MLDLIVALYVFFTMLILHNHAKKHTTKTSTHISRRKNAHHDNDGVSTHRRM